MEMEYQNTPIGQHYHAISPDESVTSANDLSEERFLSLFEVKSVEKLDDLFPRVTVEVNCDFDPSPVGWTDHVKQTLLDSSSVEDKMNAELQRALKKVSRVEGLVVHDEVDAKVAERQIRNLLEDCYLEGIQDQSLNGLPISLLSRPNFALWDTMMLSCEGKHRDTYEVGDAIRQSASYALVHLYYLLVKRAFLVESVYGVAVAGSKCRDMTTGLQFAVILLRMSLPAKIGVKLLLRNYTITEAGLLEDLWTFSNRVCRIDPTQSPVLHFGQGCPALLTMPYEVLNLSTCPSNWSMIKNGTAALILRINALAGWDFIKPYLDAREVYFEEWEEEMERNGYPCFLKSKNYLATHNPSNSVFHLTAIRRPMPALIDLQDAYKVAPVPTACGLYILMADMGMAINESVCFLKLDSPRLASKLHSFMKRVLECQKAYQVVHGDIHIGNLVYDEERAIFRLIDYDEANLGQITRRTPTTLPQMRVHNQGLIGDAEAFTKNQLINLFCVCWKGRTDVPQILSVMEEYGATYEGERNSPDAKTVNRIYHTLCDELAKYETGNHWTVAIEDNVDAVARKFDAMNPFSPRKTRTGRPAATS